MMNVAPTGPQNSYEVVRGFSSDFLSTTVEEVIGGGRRGGDRVAITIHKGKQDASHDLHEFSTLIFPNVTWLCLSDLLF